MDEQARYRQGLDLILDVWGRDYGAALMERLRALSPDFQRFVVEFLYGNLWTRPSPPAPDRKTRSLVTVATLTALGRPHQLRIHVVGALNNGASETEVEETILQVGLLAGLPAAWDALIVARRVFAEYREGRFQGAGAADASAPSFE